MLLYWAYLHLCYVICCLTYNSAPTTKCFYNSALTTKCFSQNKKQPANEFCHKLSPQRRSQNKSGITNYEICPHNLIQGALKKWFTQNKSRNSSKKSAKLHFNPTKTNLNFKNCKSVHEHVKRSKSWQEAVSILNETMCMRTTIINIFLTNPHVLFLLIHVLWILRPGHISISSTSELFAVLPMCFFG